MPRNANIKSKSKKTKGKARGRQVTAPLATSARTRNQKPVWRAHKNGTVTIQHREQFTEVYRPDTTQDYANIFGLRINPANPQVFPWLAGIAPSWENYTFEKLLFEYVPSAPSTAPGTVVLSVDYDPTDSLPVNKRDIMQMDGATSAGLWVSQTHRSTKANLSKRKELYTAPGGDADRLNDIGTLTVGIFGTEDDFSYAATGDLWVSYEIRLITPQPRNYPTSDTTFDGAWTSSAVDTDTSFARPYLFEDIAAGTLALTSTIVGEAAYPSPAGLTFPAPGNYIVTIRMFAGTTTYSGDFVDLVQSGSVIANPVDVVGQKSLTITDETKVRTQTPDLVTGVSGAGFLEHKLNIVVYSPYSSLTYSAAAITALCGVLYCRVQRNQFLDSVSATPLLPA